MRISASVCRVRENPVAPVYIDGVKAVTLKGDNIAGEFQALIERYVTKPLPVEPIRGGTRSNPGTLTSAPFHFNVE